jgi:hypothetical protein
VAKPGFWVDFIFWFEWDDGDQAVPLPSPSILSNLGLSAELQNNPIASITCGQNLAMKRLRRQHSLAGPYPQFKLNSKGFHPLVAGVKDN